MAAILGRVLDEITGDRTGSAVAIRQPGQLLLLTDEQLRPAVSAMHDQPGKPWRLDQLAREAAMSPRRYRAGPAEARNPA